MAKFEVIRDYENEVAGYKLGSHYLVKYYYWGNNYEWIINTDGKQSYFSCEFDRLYKNGSIFSVSSCKAGKEKLVELYKLEKGEK